VRASSKLFPSGIALLLACCVVGCKRDGPLEASSFSVVIDGDRVAVRVAANEPLYLQRCKVSEHVVEKRQGGDWVPLRDDRPSSSSGQPYFLDGKYEPNSASTCCFGACAQLDNPIVVGFLREYVWTGTQAAPADAEVAPATEVDVIETRLFSGPFRVRLLYSTTDACTAVHDALPTADVPKPR
jgi:hypothetical protein